MQIYFIKCKYISLNMKYFLLNVNKFHGIQKYIFAANQQPYSSHLLKCLKSLVCYNSWVANKILYCGFSKMGCESMFKNMCSQKWNCIGHGFDEKQPFYLFTFDLKA